MPDIPGPVRPGLVSCGSAIQELRRAFSRAGERALVVLARTGIAECLPHRLLDSGERIREKRFRQPADRQRFRAAHFIKRMGCAAGLGLDPSALAFAVEPGGKPMLRDFPDFFFSLSHNGGWGGAAFGRLAPLGFDVQRPIVAPRLLKSLFPGPEAGSPQSPRAFALRWAMLEAASKQDGLGLPYPLSPLEVEKTGLPAVVRLEMRGKPVFVWRGLLADGSALALASTCVKAVAAPEILELTGRADSCPLAHDGDLA